MPAQLGMMFVSERALFNFVLSPVFEGRMQCKPANSYPRWRLTVLHRNFAVHHQEAKQKTSHL